MLTLKRTAELGNFTFCMGKLKLTLVHQITCLPSSSYRGITPTFDQTRKRTTTKLQSDGRQEREANSSELPHLRKRKMPPSQDNSHNRRFISSFMGAWPSVPDSQNRIHNVQYQESIEQAVEAQASEANMNYLRNGSKADQNIGSHSGWGDSVLGFDSSDLSTRISDARHTSDTDLKHNRA